MTSNMQESKSYYKCVKGLHKGKRGFVIGNGPSLKIEDLSLLEDEITIASNKIYLAFESTIWRPTYYSIADPLLWNKIKSEVSNHFTTIHIPSYLKTDNVNANLDLKIWQHSHPPKEGRYFSNDCSDVIYGGGTVTFENLQFAVHLGLNPIYIIGCDHFYKGENSQTNSKVVIHQECNHFIENYRSKGEEVNSADINFMNRSYKEAAIFSKKEKIQIINASRKSKLIYFKRCHFDKLFL
jgi:hypothetical protein